MFGRICSVTGTLIVVDLSQVPSKGHLLVVTRDGEEIIHEYVDNIPTYDKVKNSYLRNDIHAISPVEILDILTCKDSDVPLHAGTNDPVVRFILGKRLSGEYVLPSCSLPKCVSYNRKSKLYTVRTPEGKEFSYKSQSGALKCASKHSKVIAIPQVVTANTYFWQSGRNRSERSRSEEKHQSIIDDFSSLFHWVPTLEVGGIYSESGRSVKKTMSYVRDGKSTNLTGLIGEASRWGIYLQK